MSAADLTTALSDRYRIERELGAGGMATVYLADDVRHGRKVALKVLRPDLAATLGADRFLAEIRTTANLQHPHIPDTCSACRRIVPASSTLSAAALSRRVRRSRQAATPR